MRLVKELNIEELKERVKNLSKDSAIYLGCDSQVSGSKTSFVTVVILHIDSKHGGKISYKVEREDRRMALTERLWKEVELSTSLALDLAEVIGDRYFSVHLDLNPNPIYKSNSIVSEATAYVRALGFDCEIKPNATACAMADHIVKS